jgi:hypothetical protein
VCEKRSIVKRAKVRSKEWKNASVKEIPNVRKGKGIAVGLL